MYGVRKNRILSFLITIAFMVNAIVPFLAIYNVPSALAAPEIVSSSAIPASVQAMMGDRVFICTGDRFEWVSWDELQKRAAHSSPAAPDDTPKKHKSPYECALCYVAAHGVKDVHTPTLNVWGGNIAAASAPRYAIFDQTIRTGFGRALYHSRAPPSLV